MFVAVAAERERACRRLLARCRLALTGNDAAPIAALEHHRFGREHPDFAGSTPLRIAALEVARRAAIEDGRPRLRQTRIENALNIVGARERTGEADIEPVGRRVANIVDAAIGAEQPGGGDPAILIADRTAGYVKQRSCTRDDGATGLDRDRAGLGRKLSERCLANTDPAGKIAKRRADPGAGRARDPLDTGHRTVREQAADTLVDTDRFAAQPGVPIQRRVTQFVDPHLAGDDIALHRQQHALQSGYAEIGALADIDTAVVPLDRLTGDRGFA